MKIKKNNFIFLSFIFAVLLFSSCRSKKCYETSFQAMDTVMTVKVWSTNRNIALRALEESKKKITDLEKLLSVNIPKSTVYLINHQENYPFSIEISDDFADLIRKSIHMSEISDGNFNICLYPVTSLWGFTTDNPHVPEKSLIDEVLPACNRDNISLIEPGDRWGNLRGIDYEGNCDLIVMNGSKLDFGGIAKGYAGDEVLKILKDFKIENAVIDLGGNIQTLGRRYDETAWKIGIKDPEEPEKIICSVEVISKAVITSAGYERYFTDEYGKKYPHIFDSKTGYPAESDILSATIISKDGYYGDALSTAFYVMGSEKAYKLWQKQKDFDFIIITNDKEIFISENLEKMVKVSEASDYYFRTLP
ncbi:MAG: FAD:protein FMN transferase [Spirochaetales bacterium]|nr:FAD:protein FMN transferase [Spirochaetales bacterium]